MLDKSLEFLKLLRDLEEVKRTIHRNSERLENDVEHSYQVAMMSWFLADQFQLNLSREKLLSYGLVHDLVEVHAGDTPAYKNQEGVATKEAREKEALATLKRDYAHFPSLIDAILKYESKTNAESVFVYEVDKLVPALNIYLDDGYGWNKLGLELKKIKEEKRSKIKNTKELVSLLEETLARFEKEEARLFEKR